MTDDPDRPTTGDGDPDPPSDRREPVGAPVVRGDPEITGAHARDAEGFDPDDPASLGRAVAVVREFATDPDGDHLSMLRGAAACAALVRGEGSYKAAAARAGEPVSVTFLRKWARVHDLPISIRKRIARGEIPPTAASHIARTTGDARFLIAWAVADYDLPVRTVRQIATAVTDGTPIEDALRTHDVPIGQITATVPLSLYREAHRRASLENVPLETLVIDALSAWLTATDD